MLERSILQLLKWQSRTENFLTVTAISWRQPSRSTFSDLTQYESHLRARTQSRTLKYGSRRRYVVPGRQGRFKCATWAHSCHRVTGIAYLQSARICDVGKNNPSGWSPQDDPSAPYNNDGKLNFPFRRDVIVEDISEADSTIETLPLPPSLSLRVWARDRCVLSFLVSELFRDEWVMTPLDDAIWDSPVRSRMYNLAREWPHVKLLT